MTQPVAHVQVRLQVSHLKIAICASSVIKHVSDSSGVWYRTRNRHNLKLSNGHQVFSADTDRYPAVIFVCWDRDPFTQMNPDCYQVLRANTNTYSEGILLAVIFVCWDRDPFTQTNPDQIRINNTICSIPVQILKSRLNA
jgi:hypothetical protein